MAFFIYEESSGNFLVNKKTPGDAHSLEMSLLPKNSDTRSARQQSVLLDVCLSRECTKHTLFFIIRELIVSSQNTILFVLPFYTSTTPPLFFSYVLYVTFYFSLLIHPLLLCKIINSKI